MNNTLSFGNSIMNGRALSLNTRTTVWQRIIGNLILVFRGMDPEARTKTRLEAELRERHDRTRGIRGSRTYARLMGNASQNLCEIAAYAIMAIWVRKGQEGPRDAEHGMEMLMCDFWMDGITHEANPPQKHLGNNWLNWVRMYGWDGDTPDQWFHTPHAMPFQSLCEFFDRADQDRFVKLEQLVETMAHHIHEDGYERPSVRPQLVA